MNNRNYEVRDYARLGQLYPHAIVCRDQVGDAATRAICKDLKEARIWSAAHAMLTFIQGINDRSWHRGTLTLDYEEKCEIEALIATATGFSK